MGLETRLSDMRDVGPTAVRAAQIGLAAIIGAFPAGMIEAETKDRSDFEEGAPLYAFFPPFFFVFIGLEVELDAFTDPGPSGCCS